MSSQDFTNKLNAVRALFEGQHFEDMLLQGKALLKHDAMKALDKADFVLPGAFYFDLQAFLEAITQSKQDFQWNCSPWYQVNLWCAHSAYALTYYAEAERFLDVLKTRTRSPVFWHLQGRWFYEQGLIDEALKEWAKALALDSDYLPVFEDIITLANTAQLPEDAFALIQWASTYQMTPHLFEELLLAASKTDFISMRSLFLELCVQYMSLQTLPLLKGLLERLYADEDYHHSHYLGFHLLLMCPEDEEIRSLYLFSALRQKHYSQALQALLQLPESVKNGLYYYQIGQVFLFWNMPMFATEFFIYALKNLDEPSELIQQVKADYYRLKSRNQVFSEGEMLKAFIKRMGIDKRFKQRFLDHFQEIMLDYHLPVTSSWQRLYKMMQTPMI